MSRRLVALVVLAQLLVLAWMAGEREWILRTGKVIFLRTAPVDPRDLFRGDFVRLQYEINSPRAETSEPVATPEANSKRHEVVYTRLKPAGEGLYEADGVSSTQPDDGVFLRGRTENSWRMGWRGNAHYFVTYGIEQLFVEQGSGQAIEDRRGTRGQMQVPMEVEVAIGASGKALIRGYRWSRLGVKLEILRRPAPRGRNVPPVQGAAPEAASIAPAPLSPKLRLTLSNTSSEPLALIDPGEHCALHLVPTVMTKAAYPAAYDCAGVPATADDVKTLAPGATYAVDIDLSEPRWHLLAGGKPVEAGTLPPGTQFRLEYRAPAPVADRVAPTTVWNGRLASQAFNAQGMID
jgi:uncharacterized membrane-anchored protein